MTQFVLLPKLFFFGFFFQCVGVCQRVVVVRLVETARDDGSRANAVAPPPRPGIEPGPASTRRHAFAPRSRIVWSYSSWSVRRRSTASERGKTRRRVSPNPGSARRRFRRPPASAPLARTTRGVLLANNPETERTIAHHRSFHRPPPFLSSASGRSSFRGRRRRMRNKSIRRASPRVSFAAAASRRVFVLVSRRRGSRARPRRAFVRTSLPPHRDGGERAPRSIGAPPRRVRRLVSRYLILSICLLHLKKKKRRRTA